MKQAISFDKIKSGLLKGDAREMISRLASLARALGQKQKAKELRGFL